MTKTEMQQVLDALHRAKLNDDSSSKWDAHSKAIAIMQAAVDAPEQPVAQPSQDERDTLVAALRMYSNEGVQTDLARKCQRQAADLLQSEQPKQEPLKDEQIASICLAQTGFEIEGYNLTDYAIMDFARAIEAAHSIGDKT